MAKKKITQRVRPRVSKKPKRFDRKAARNPQRGKSRRVQKTKRTRPARVTPRSRRFQQTESLVKEREIFKYGKGSKPISSSDGARDLLSRLAKPAKRRFSRKKSSRFAARITLRWKSKDGKWRSRSLVQVSTSLEKAIEGLLENDEINSLTYETKDGVREEIGSATKRITAVSFDKYTHGKISKTARKKTKAKKTRRIRHRK